MFCRLRKQFAYESSIKYLTIWGVPPTPSSYAHEPGLDVEKKTKFAVFLSI
jgi:hypothetical protein